MQNIKNTLFFFNYKMTLRTTSISLFTISFFLSCSQIVKRNNRHKELELKSRVAEFYYGGYGDTTCATLIGQVFSFKHFN